MFFDSEEDLEQFGVTPNMARLPQFLSGILRNYDPAAQAVAQRLIPLYGQPDEATATHLIWKGPAPFVCTVLSAKATPHNFPSPHSAVLEQCVLYPLGNASGKYDDLGAYNGSVTVKRTEGLLCARSDDPGTNLLMLNLAHDIITGRKSYRDARTYHVKAGALYKAGKVPKYTAQLTFAPEPGADPDVSA